MPVKEKRCGEVKSREMDYIKDTSVLAHAGNDGHWAVTGRGNKFFLG